jgi:hypothetical protein
MRNQITSDQSVNVPDRISAAIAAANYKENGAQFEPFKLKAATAADFNWVWSNERGNYDIVFYQFKGRADGFLPLGDFAINWKGYTMDNRGALLFKASKDGALAHPIGFIWLLDDKHSGNSHDIHYWLPVPPEGYSALGICFSGTGSQQPDVNNYWCVRNDYLREIGKADYWSDSGQNWGSHNGNLLRPVLTQSQLNTPTEEVLIVPTTYFNVEGPQIPAKALVARQLYLTVEEVPRTLPTFDPQNGEGTVTPVGLGKVAVLPYTAIADGNTPMKPKDSPFYYLACEPFYHCNESLPTPAGGSIERSFSMGTSVTDSRSFKDETSISVGANAGINVDGFSSGITTTFTHTFSIETAHSETNQTEVTEKITLNFPSQPITQVWQRMKRIALYRTSGIEAAAVTYKVRDYLFRPEGTTK